MRLIDARITDYYSIGEAHIPLDGLTVLTSHSPQLVEDAVIAVDWMLKGGVSSPRRTAPPDAIDSEFLFGKLSVALDHRNVRGSADNSLVSKQVEEYACYTLDLSPKDLVLGLDRGVLLSDVVAFWIHGSDEGAPGDRLALGRGIMKALKRKSVLVRDIAYTGIKVDAGDLDDATLEAARRLASWEGGDELIDIAQQLCNRGEALALATEEGFGTKDELFDVVDLGRGDTRLLQSIRTAIGEIAEETEHPMKPGTIRLSVVMPGLHDPWLEVHSGQERRAGETVDCVESSVGDSEDETAVDVDAAHDAGSESVTDSPHVQDHECTAESAAIDGDFATEIDGDTDSNVAIGFSLVKRQPFSATTPVVMRASIWAAAKLLGDHATRLAPSFIRDHGSIEVVAHGPLFWHTYIDRVHVEYWGNDGTRRMIEDLPRGTARWVTIALQLAIEDLLACEGSPGEAMQKMRAAKATADTEFADGIDLAEVCPLVAPATNRYLIIEEPELHLPPDAVASVGKWLEAAGRAHLGVLTTTFSPVIAGLDANVPDLAASARGASQSSHP